MGLVLIVHLQVQLLAQPEIHIHNVACAPVSVTLLHSSPDLPAINRCST